MLRVMYDSTTPTDIPTTAQLVAGYVDGAYAWGPDGWARFTCPKVRIAVLPTTADGDVIDCEQGDATPVGAASWALGRRRQGHPLPVVYCNRSNRGPVEDALKAIGLGASDVGLWVATLDGTQQVEPGAFPLVAVQYVGEPGSGGHYDLSVVLVDHWPGVDPTVVPEEMDVQVEPPFKAKYYERGAHWSSNPQGSDDQGAANLTVGTVVSIVEVSDDGRFVRPDLGSQGSSWWLPSSTFRLVLEHLGAVAPHTHSLIISGTSSPPVMVS